MRLADVVAKDDDDWLSHDEFEYLKAAHLDFVVVNAAGDPILAVEFDGPSHNDPEGIARDVIKNRLCKKARVELLRIRGEEIATHEQVTVLDYMLELFISWPREEGAIARDIQDFITEAEPDGIHPDDLDPALWFRLRHPFRPKKTVMHRLLHRYNIDTFGTSARTSKTPRMICEVHPIALGPDKDNEEYFTVGQRAVVKKSYTDEKVLFAAERSASIRSFNPTDLNISLSLLGPPEGSGEEFFKLVEWRIKHMWTPLEPSVSGMDIAYELAQYYAFKAVEDWAKGLKTR